MSRHTMQNSTYSAYSTCTPSYRFSILTLQKHNLFVVSFCKLSTRWRETLSFVVSYVHSVFAGERHYFLSYRMYTQYSLARDIIFCRIASYCTLSIGWPETLSFVVSHCTLSTRWPETLSFVVSYVHSVLAGQRHYLLSYRIVHSVLAGQRHCLLSYRMYTQYSLARDIIFCRIVCTLSTRWPETLSFVVSHCTLSTRWPETLSFVVSYVHLVLAGQRHYLLSYRMYTQYSLARDIVFCRIVLYTQYSLARDIIFCCIVLYTQYSLARDILFCRIVLYTQYSLARDIIVCRIVLYTQYSLARDIIVCRIVLYTQYSLARDIISLLKRPKTFGTQYKQPPLVRSLTVGLPVPLCLYLQ